MSTSQKAIAATVLLGIPYLAVIDRRDPSKLIYGSSSTSFTLTRGRVYVVRISKSHFQKVNDIPQSRLYILGLTMLTSNVSLPNVE